jgi:hypothetical protein
MEVCESVFRKGKLTMDITQTEQPANEIPQQTVWEHRIQERQQSGKSIRQYCAEQGIKEWQYYKWQRKLSSAREPARGFMELKTKPSLRRIVVEVCGCRIEVERGFDTLTFKEIVSVLRTA